MVTCKEVATAIGRDEWRTASWRRRLALRLHLLMCSACRRYAAQIRAVGTAARSLFGEHCEDPTVLKRLHQTILGLPESTPTSRDVER